MMDLFRKLFQLDFNHEYYGKSNNNSIFQMEAPILNNSLGIKLKSTKNGYFTFFKSSLVSNLEQESPQWVALYFPIRILNPNFFNFTAIDFSPSKVFCISNEQAVGCKISANTGKVLDYRPSQFVYPLKLNVLKSIKSIHIINPIDKIYSLPLPLAPYGNGYPINLTGELEGKYELLITLDQPKEVISYNFFYTNQVFLKNIKFIFEYKINLNLFVTKPEPLTYFLLFKARTTYWRYIFTGFEKKEWDSVKISSIEIDNTKISFKKADKAILLKNGQFAFEALSTESIPLWNSPTWKVWINSNRLSEKILLPYPNPRNLTMPDAIKFEEVHQSTKLISEIYCQF